MFLIRLAIIKSEDIETHIQKKGYDYDVKLSKLV